MNKKLETFLYSFGGVLAVIAIALAVNLIINKSTLRVDLTEDKLYTLSPGTRAILQQLDTPVKIRLYVETGQSPESVYLKSYADRVEDLLNEFQQVAKGNLEVEKYNPQPDTDAEDSANLDGVEGQMDRSGDKVYLGLAVSCLDQRVAIPFLSPDRERLLEYDLARAVSGVVKTDKPVIGVLTSLPVFGMPMNPMMMRMGQRGQEPWIFINELKRDFTVRQIEPAVEKIDDEIKLLIVLHPKDLSVHTQFALDQFLMRGGKMIAFLDPLATVDSSGRQMPMGFSPPSSSSLPKLLEAWGVQFDTSKVVADMNFVTRFVNNNQPQAYPAALSLTEEGVNTDDAITSQVDSLMMLFAGQFSGTPAAGLTQTVLLHSTEASQLVDAMMAENASEQIIRSFKPSGKEHALAIRLAGKFKTAFPDGSPAKEADKTEADKPAEEAKKAEAKPASSLKESPDTAVILVGDVDMIYDQFCVQVQEVFGQRIIIPRNGNLSLAQGMVEQLAGDNRLIGVRSRATMTRPFTRIREIQAQAEENYRAKIAQLEESLSETQQRLNELQQNKDKGQRFILSPEQQKELENFKKQEVQVQRELRELRKNLRQDIDSLENRLRWLNIAGMPLLVTISGITLALFKRKRTAAK